MLAEKENEMASTEEQPAAQARVEFVLLRLGEHWLEESPDDKRLRTVANPTQGSLFAAETASGGHRLWACGSARPLVLDDSGVPALGDPAEPGPVFHLPVAEWTPPASVDVSEGAAAPSLADAARAGALAGYRIAPHALWNDREHKQLVEDAFAAVMRFPDDQAGVARVKALWNNADFKAGVFQGLHDADYVRPYTSPLPIAPIPTYASHFFDPDTKQNWAPLLFPSQTAYSETLRFAQEAADLAGSIANGGGKAAAGAALADSGAEDFLGAQPSGAASMPAAVPNTLHGQCGYRLGLALHYFTDLTQPMHAANFINAPWSGDWRHSGFEEGADERAPAFRIDPARVSWADIDPGPMQYVAQLLMQVARNSKRIFIEKVEPALKRKVQVVTTSRGAAIVYDNAKWGAEADPILRDAIPAGQLAATRFLVMWGRMSAFHGPGAVYWPRSKPWSDHAPFFFAFRGRTYIVYVDTYLGKNDVYVQPYDNAEVEPRRIASDVKGVPSVVEFQGRLLMAFARGEAIECLSSTDAQNWGYARPPANAQIMQHSRPALCVHQGQVFMMWVNPGSTMFWCTLSSLDSRSWGSPTRMAGIAASHSPTLAVFGGRLYAAWTGQHKADWVFYARYENRAWSSQDSLEAAVVKSNSAPALVAADGMLLVFYRRSSDSRICFSRTTDGHVWDGGCLYPIPGDYTAESDVVASPLPWVDFVGWSRGYTFVSGYKASHRLMCAPVSPPRSYVEIPDGALVQAFGRPEIHVVCGYAKFHVPSTAAFHKMNLKAWDVRREPAEVVDALKSTPTDGSLVRELTDPRVWYVAAGARLHVENARELTQLAGGRTPQFTTIPDGTVGAIAEKFQRENVAIKVSVNPGEPLNDVPLRGWRIFNLVRIGGEILRSPVDISAMADEQLRQLVEVALPVPQSALRTPSAP